MAQEAHKEVKKLLLNLKSSALAEIRSYPRPPKYTVRVIRSILYILGAGKADVSCCVACHFSLAHPRPIRAGH